LSLDLSKIAAAVSRMAEGSRAGFEEKQQHLSAALEAMAEEGRKTEELKKKIDSSKTSWLLVGLTDGLAGCYPAPMPPPEFCVLASDGSHIDVDRHQSARCYLINIGSATLHYSETPKAVLENHPKLYSNEEDFVIAELRAGGREQIIEATLLGIKRNVQEVEHLVGLATALPQECPALALVDGSLIIWGLTSQSYPKFVVEALLDNGFLKDLDRMLALSKQRPLALASYISFPGSTDVVNSVRVALCPNQPVNCDQFCREIPNGRRVCDRVTGLRDRDLFAALLEPGQRSSLFKSSSSILSRYGKHQVYFCYVKVSDEIARLEMPEWTATDGKLLNLAHALVLDQCQRGHGYPVALSEAHEQAVITGADRQQFTRLMETVMAEAKLPLSSSAKSQSKRTRWV